MTKEFMTALLNLLEENHKRQIIVDEVYPYNDTYETSDLKASNISLMDRLKAEIEKPEPPVVGWMTKEGWMLDNTAKKVLENKYPNHRPQYSIPLIVKGISENDNSF